MASWLTFTCPVTSLADRQLGQWVGLTRGLFIVDHASLVAAVPGQQRRSSLPVEALSWTVAAPNVPFIVPWPALGMAKP